MKLADQLKSMSMQGSPAYRAAEFLQQLETYVEETIQYKINDADMWAQERGFYPGPDPETIAVGDRALLAKLREGA